MSLVGNKPLVMIVDDAILVRGLGTAPMGRILVESIAVGQMVEIDPGFITPMRAKVISISRIERNGRSYSPKRAKLNQYVGILVSPTEDIIKVKSGMKVYLLPGA